MVNKYIKPKIRKNIFMNPWLPLIIGPFLIVSLFVVHFYYKAKIDRELSQQSNGFDSSYVVLKSTLKEVLETHRLPWESQRGSKVYQEFWRVWVPTDLPIPSLHLDIQEKINQIGAVILFAESEPVSGCVTLHIGWQDSSLFRIRLFHVRDVRREKGRIALLIDDFGDRWDQTVVSFIQLGADLTYSVIPGEKMSLKVAREMAKRGCEVILHMPMEPLNSSFRKNQYMILTEMNKQKIYSIIQRSLSEVPDAVGVNNHMGSKATSDRQTMICVLEEIKREGLYFVDSRTIASSVAYDVAQSLGLKCGQRDVFIDVDKNREIIRRKVWELAHKAKSNGFAIGIGHCQRMTLDVLREEIPKIQAEGYRFVRLSEVVR
jgi:polysaccharide deacetylase 2 family uncharacterized protein YibQ